MMQLISLIPGRIILIELNFDLILLIWKLFWANLVYTKTLTPSWPVPPLMGSSICEENWNLTLSDYVLTIGFIELCMKVGFGCWECLTNQQSHNLTGDRRIGLLLVLGWNLPRLYLFAAGEWAELIFDVELSYWVNSSFSWPYQVQTSS